jgi:peptidyl-prolyl cis-trans isomerase SurA
MIFPQSLQSTAILILSASLSAAPSFAQATNAHSPSSINPPPATQAAPVTGKVVEDIVARVNDQIVTQSDYDRAAQQLDSEAKQQAIPAPELEKRQADLLRDLIDQQLLLSKGKELGITGETELVKRLDDLRKQNHLDSLEDLEKAAQQQGYSYEDFKANIRNNIITQQVVRDEVGRHITMSPGDVQRYYKEHESEFAQPESVNLNEILIPTPEAADPAQVTAAQAQADAIAAKLSAGAKFEDVAKNASSGPDGVKSVTLGEFRRGMLAKEIEDKAFALNAGQYTQPIRTKQGFIILQVAEHTLGGDAGFKQAEPQVEEALFMENMQPKLREYLTRLRGEAFVEIKPGAVDTGSNGNEMRLTYSAYTPPPPKKKKKFQRTRFRGKAPSTPLQTAAASTPPAAGSAAVASTVATTPAATAPAATAPPAGTTQQASNTNQNVQTPGKREKIRFGQAPRESLPAGQVAAASTPSIGPDATAPGVTTPETRYVNPDGSLSSTTAPATERKTRLSNRAPVPKAKRSKSADTSDAPTADELATQKVQDSPLGLADQTQAKKTKQKGDKTRYSAKPKEPEQTPQPYLGTQPASTTQPPTPPATSQPAPSSSEPAPSAGPPAAQPPAATQP